MLPLRHLIRVMRSHEITNKKTMTKTNTKTKAMTMTKTNTFREHIQRATLETCDLWDILSEWWEDMTWPKKIKWQRQRQWQWQWQWQRHLENTHKEQSYRLVAFVTPITFLTIENNNLKIYSYPWTKSNKDSICNSGAVFVKASERESFVPHKQSLTQ